MVNTQKHSFLKNCNKNHKKILNQYHIHFSPLVLPKLAIQGYKLTPDPSCHFFLSQLTLMDKVLIKRQNEFIDFMKHTYAKGRPELLASGRRISLFDLLTLASKENKICSHVQQNRHRYCQILKLRLKDLNEWIFHVERLNKVPQKQKACRTLIQKEINRLSENSQTSNKIKTSNDKIKEEEQHKQYFSIAHYKKLEYSQRQQNINNIYNNYRKDNSRKSYAKMATEPNQLKSSYCNMISMQTRNSEAIEDIQISPSNIQNVLSSSAKAPIKLVPRNSKQKHLMRYSMNYNYENKSGVNGKQNQTARRSNFIQPVMRQGALVKTSQNIKQRKNKINTGKSVRYLIEERQQQNSDDQNFLKTHKKRGSQASSKAKKQSKASSLKSKISSEADESMKRTPILKATAKSRFLNENDENKAYVKRRDSRRNSMDCASSREFQSQNHYESDISIKRHYANAKKHPMRPAKLRRDKQKISAFFPQFQEDNIQSLHSFHPASSKHNLKIFRRQGEMIQKDNRSEPIITTNIKSKRRGQIVHKQISKLLERLVTQKNIQDMILNNEIQTPPNERSRYIINEIKNKTKKMLTFKDLSSMSQKHIISNKNNIMMEVDLNHEHEQYNNLKNKYLNDYVNNLGLAVKVQQLAGVKKQFVDASPYEHQVIAEFYGGSYLKSVDQEFITNEKGQYQFNRNFIQHLKKQSSQLYCTISPQIDPSQNMAFQFGISLIRDCQDLGQRAVAQPSF